jgi:hypothetical protein
VRSITWTREFHPNVQTFPYVFFIPSSTSSDGAIQRKDCSQSQSRRPKISSDDALPLPPHHDRDFSPPLGLPPAHRARHLYEGQPAPPLLLRAPNARVTD